MSFLGVNHSTYPHDLQCVSMCLFLSQVKFLDVDEEAGKLVVSQKRAAMEGVTFDLKRGAVVSGTITGTFKHREHDLFSFILSFEFLCRRI